jgi:enoyl reductase-like protein
MPFDWAQIEQDLGNALTTLGERQDGAEALKAAVAAHNAALEVFVAADADYFITICRNDRNRALAFLAARIPGR